MQKIWDVLVVGGGPAGSAAALKLARYGHQVAVIDKRDFPRDKVCGDGLIADSIHYLKRVGLFEQVKAQSHELHEVSVFSPSQNRVDIPGYALTIRRQILDDILLRAARDAGAVVLMGKVNALKTDGRVVSVSVMGQADSIQARFVVLATGSDITLLKQVGIIKHASKPSAVAARAYLRSSVNVTPMVLSFDRSIIPGYAWIFPMKDNEYNIGCGYAYDRMPKITDPRALFQLFCQQFPLAKQLVEAGEFVSPIQGSVLRCGLDSERCQKDNILAVGETVFSTFPFTGEGIGKAMETGELASELIHQAIHAGSLTPLIAYSSHLKTTLKPKYRGYEIAQKWCGYAWFIELVVRRAQKSPRIRTMISQVLDESIDLGRALSFWRVVKSLLKRK